MASRRSQDVAKLEQRAPEISNKQQVRDVGEVIQKETRKFIRTPAESHSTKVPITAIHSLK